METQIVKYKKEKHKNMWNVFSITFFVLLTIYAITIFFSVGWMLMTTFKHKNAFAGDVFGFPDFSLFKQVPYEISGVSQKVDSIFANYIVMFSKFEYTYNGDYWVGIVNQQLIENDYYISGGLAFLIFLFNSIWQVFAGTFLPMIMQALMGYMCIKYNYKFSRFLYAVVVLSMAMPVFGSQAAIINLQRNLRMYNNIPGFLIWNCNWVSMYFLIFYSYYQGLADSYIEAAEIDGASQFRILATIALPLASNMIMATVVLLFVGVWNDYSMSLMYLPSYPTMAYGIYYNTVAFPTLNYVPVKFATLMYLAVPATIFFICFRKQLMGNVSLGGIKE